MIIGMETKGEGTKKNFSQIEMENIFISLIFPPLVDASVCSFLIFFFLHMSLDMLLSLSHTAKHRMMKKKKKNLQWSETNSHFQFSKPCFSVSPAKYKKIHNFRLTHSHFYFLSSLSGCTWSFFLSSSLPLPFGWLLWTRNFFCSSLSPTTTTTSFIALDLINFCVIL